jgi:hypothetical protein
MILSSLHAPLIDSPASTCLFTFLTIASLSKFEKRRLFLLYDVVLAAPSWRLRSAIVILPQTEMDESAESSNCAAPSQMRAKMT